MSLTNPDKLVTEERLNEYHNTILPYLGGMPDILANKFSRGDMYSTDEKMIAQWIDGRPLYQKTIQHTTGDVGSSYVYEYENIGASVRIGFVVEAISLLADGTTVPFGSGYLGSESIDIMRNGAFSHPNTVRFSLKGNDRSHVPIYATIRYTKTTDRPVAIGIDTDYSTEEKIVGTWIDGKPVYQKTYDCGAGPNATTKSVPLGFTDYDHIYSIEGIIQSTTLKSYSVIPMVHNTTMTRQLNVAIYNNAIQLQGGAFDFSQYDKIYITIKYTKTTD